MSLRVTSGLALGFIALVTAIFLLLGLLLSGYVGDQNQRQALFQLRQKTELAAIAAMPIVAGSSSISPAQTAEQIAVADGTRVTIFRADGTPLADSAADISTISNQSQDSAFRDALNGTSDQTRLPDPNTGISTWYSSAPIRQGDHIAGVLRLAVPASQLTSGYSGEQTIIVLLLVGAGWVTLLAIWVFTRVAVRPLTKIVAATQLLSSGDLTARVPVEGTGDFADVSVAFNEMANELQSTVGAIELERRRLDSVVEHLGDGIVIVDQNDRVVLMNLSAETLLGVHRSWAVGRTYAQVFRDYELAAVVREGRSQDGVASTPPTHFIEMGHPRRSVQAFSYPIPSDQSQLILVVLRDITEFRRTEAVRRDFVANVSHDLRTPIASMKALVETLLDGALEDETVAREFLSRTQVEVDDLARLVEELLQLSRAEAGQIELHLAPANLELLIRRVAQRMRAQASLKRISVSIVVASDLPQAMCDVDRIEQVLVNLVHNAIKFTPHDGKIEIRAGVNDGEIVVAVEDSGPGLDPSDLNRVFERFYKADRSRSAAGSGLGLAIAKHLIQLHGGRIWADSDYGRGATFSFSLPIDTPSLDRQETFIESPVRTSSTRS